MWSVFLSEILPQQTLFNDGSQSTSFIVVLFGKGREIQRKCKSVAVGEQEHSNRTATAILILSERRRALQKVAIREF